MFTFKVQTPHIHHKTNVETNSVSNSPMMMKRDPYTSHLVLCFTVCFTYSYIVLEQQYNVQIARGRQIKMTNDNFFSSSVKLLNTYT